MKSEIESILKPGTVAMVTGASSGIGRSTARALADLGLRVICTARSMERLEPVVSELGDRGYGIALDVNDEDGIRDALKTLPVDWRNIDILVNNAGHDAGGWQFFQDLKMTDSEQVIETNVIGLIRMTAHVIDGMLERDRGHIVNIGSTSGFTPLQKSSVYCASKFAVRGFTESLRKDVADTRLRVTEIDPGVVITDFALNRYKGDKSAAQEFVESYPQGLSPEDIARAIVFALQQPPGVMINRIVIEPTFNG